MSENTNTPNGDSKYESNEDTGRQVFNVIDMSEQDPNKDLTGMKFGDNTKVDSSISIENTGIRDFGYVEIVATLVGQPVKVNEPNFKSSLEKMVKDARNKVLSRKGVVPIEVYIESKKNKEKSKQQPEEPEKEDEK